MNLCSCAPLSTFCTYIWHEELNTQAVFTLGRWAALWCAPDGAAVVVADGLTEAAGVALPAVLFSLSILRRPSKRSLQRWSWYQP